MEPKGIKGICAVLFLLCVLVPQIVAHSKFYNVLHFGAKGDGKAIDTHAIQKALDSCDGKDDCTVYFPPGYTFLTYPLVIKADQTTMQIDANITLPFYDEAKHKWEKKDGNYVSFITNSKSDRETSDMRNIVITGNGTITGYGWDWYGAPERPRMIELNNIENVEVSYLSLRDSPSFHVIFNYCKKALAYRLDISAPSYMFGTDGIDALGSTDVVIKECRVSNGDDSVAIKENCHNVLVEDCMFEMGHGATIGSIRSGFTSNVTFRSIYEESMAVALKIRIENGTDGHVQNITFEHFLISNATIGIELYMYYGQTVNTTLLQEEAKHTLKHLPKDSMSGIYFHDIIGHDIEAPGTFVCSYCNDIVLKDVNLSQSRHKKIINHGEHERLPYFLCVNAFGNATNTSPKSCLEEKDPYLY